MMRGRIVRGCWLDERGLLCEEEVAEELEGRAGVVRCEPTPFAPLSVRGRRLRNHVCRSALTKNKSKIPGIYKNKQGRRL